MRTKDVLDRALSSSALSKADVSRALGVSRVTTTRTMAADDPRVRSVARYLSARGYRLWAVPESLHLDAISDDCMMIDADAQAGE